MDTWGSGGVPMLHIPSILPASSPSWAAGGELSPGEDGLAQEKLGPETGTGGCVSPPLLLQASEGLSGWMSLVASVGGKWDSCLLRKT